MTATLATNDRTEYMQSLYRAFVVGKANFIRVDGHSSEFIMDATAFALDENLIEHDPQRSKLISDSQYTGLAYILTKKGKEELARLPVEQR